MVEKHKKISHHIDIHVGKKVRIRRVVLGMSQENLGDAVGITFQQIQKYEKGLNRIGAGRLYEFSRILNVPVSYFFEEVEAAPEIYKCGVDDDLASARENKETLSLVRAFDFIKDPVVRRRIVSLAKSLRTDPKDDQQVA